MILHREGKVSILIILCLLLAAVVVVYVFSMHWLVNLLVVAPAAVLLILILWFFRVPAREPFIDKNKVVAPADGKIVVIENVKESEYFNDERIQISIFMSPLNVHQNVYPVSGEIVYTKYHKGKYLVAWHPKSSTENERSTVVIKRHDGIEILMRQIAGAMARRICTYSKVGDDAQMSGEMGFIKFGSRVDIFLPVNARIMCRIGQKSINKQTVLAEL